MKIFYMDWRCFAGEDICQALGHLAGPGGRGVEVVRYPFQNTEKRTDPAFEEAFLEALRGNGADAVFSFNYYPLISLVCQRAEIPYIAYVYDSPHISLYSYTILHPCNHVYVFDSQVAEAFRRQGIGTVHYLPLAVNARRMEGPGRAMSPRRFEADIAFVGGLYTEAHTFYDRMEPRLDDYTRGYLRAVMEAQLMVDGVNFVEQCLTPPILERMQRAYPMEPNPDGAETAAWIYANYMIDRKLTQTERQKLLRMIGERFGKERRVAVYTRDAGFTAPGILNRGRIDYYDEMPDAFRHARINLNFTLRSIGRGIPLRVFDILGAGAFLLTNYQEDLLEFFVPGEDLVIYESDEDLLDKIGYYLAHDEARERIARSGHARVLAGHSWEDRLRQILGEVFGAGWADPTGRGATQRLSERGSIEPGETPAARESAPDTGEAAAATGGADTAGETASPGETTTAGEAASAPAPGGDGRRRSPISAVIVSYNDRQLMVRCLEALSAQLGVPGDEIVVVDNGSTDGVLEDLAEIQSRGLRSQQVPRESAEDAGRSDGLPRSEIGGRLEYEERPALDATVPSMTEQLQDLRQRAVSEGEEAASRGACDASAREASPQGKRETEGTRPPLRLLENGSNVGFPVGCNIGYAAAAPGNDILLLNNDAILAEGALDRLSAALYSSPKIGATGAVSNNALEQVEPGAPQAPEEALAFGAALARQWDQRSAQGSEAAGSRALPWEYRSRLTGFCVLVKRAAADRLAAADGYFLDPRFSPGYFEDEDLGVRLALAGCQQLLCHDAFVYHKGGEGFASHPEALWRGRERFAEKWGFDAWAHIGILGEYEDAVEAYLARRSDLAAGIMARAGEEAPEEPQRSETSTIPSRALCPQQRTQDHSPGKASRGADVQGACEGAEDAARNAPIPLVTEPVRGASEGKRPAEPLRLLELDCGMGVNLAHLRYLYPGCGAVGIESAPTLATIAATSIDVICATPEEALAQALLPGTPEAKALPAGGFDLIFAWDAWERSADPDGLRERLAELLKPGGRIIS